MKKIVLVFTIILLLVSPLFAVSPTSPVATVNLIKNTVIKQAELTQMLNRLGAGEEQALDVLEILINDELFLQGAAREGIKITDRELDNLVAMQKQNFEAQLGQALTEEEFTSIVASQFGPMDVFKDTIKNQYILQTYLSEVKKDELASADINPTDADIKTFYNRNKSAFVQAENVKFYQIIKEKTNDAKTDAETKALYEKVYNDLKYNRITFEEAVNLYTGDEESKAVGGEAGWLASDNETIRTALGNDFVDFVLSLPIGQISPVIESDLAFHIVKNTVHNDPKFLGLNDKISPEESTTVYQYIGSILAQQNQEQFLAQLTLDIINELKAEANIRILI